ncbi:MAG: hypothetical protein VZR27_10655 [Acutalibacteraceae bacterium]|nr:hypothetical protein [Acutalibacteraceae bacterium]
MKLTPEARAARAAYMREWRKKNKDKEREYEARKWERKARQIREERERENQTAREAGANNEESK